MLSVFRQSKKVCRTDAERSCDPAPVLCGAARVSPRPGDHMERWGVPLFVPSHIDRHLAAGHLDILFVKFLLQPAIEFARDAPSLE